MDNVFAQGAVVAVIGLCTVFLVLMILWGVLELMRIVFTAGKKPAEKAAAPAPAAKPAAPAGAQGAVSVTAPMPGTVLQIKAKAGDAVKRGQAVVILEAMKMENEIVAPQDGVIASVNVSQGDSVNNGDVLMTMN